MALLQFALSDIWGIVRRLRHRLKGLSIYTPLDLSVADTKFIRKRFGVMLERIVLELNGFSCLELKQIVQNRKNLVASRSFGRPITILHEMRQAIVTHAICASEQCGNKILPLLILSFLLSLTLFKNDSHNIQPF